MSAESYDYTIVISAAILAIIFVRLAYWSKYKSLLIPYYQPHDISQIGYIQFSELAKELPIYRGIFYYKLLIPLWAIIYLFILLLLEYLLPTSVEVSTDYFYFFVFALGFCLFDWWNLNRTIFRFAFLFVIPYLIGQYLFESTFGGYLAVAFALSTAIAFFLKDSVEILFFQKEVEKKSNRSLIGEDLSKFKSTLSFLMQLSSVVFIPLFMIFTIAKMVINGFTVNSITSLNYQTYTFETLTQAAPLLVVYLNLTLLGLRGILRFVQRDLFHALDKRIALNRLKPSVFAANEKEVDEAMPIRDTHGWTLTMPAEARIQNPSLIDFTSFQYLLAFFFLDGVLTFSTVLGLKWIPGLSIAEIGVVSSVLKLIFYLGYIYHSIRILFYWISKNPNRWEKLTNFKHLLIRIQHQQTSDSPYMEPGGLFFESEPLPQKSNTEKKLERYIKKSEEIQRKRMAIIKKGQFPGTYLMKEDTDVIQKINELKQKLKEEKDNN